MIKNSAQTNMPAQENETGVVNGLIREPLHIGELELNSHPIMGAGGATSMDTLERTPVTSSTELTAVAMRRFTPGTKQSVSGILQRNDIAALPDTAGYYIARDAVPTTQLAREALGTDLLKLEVTADEDAPLPGLVELVAVAEWLVTDDFVVFVYTNDDPTSAKWLEDLGCAAIMPADSPIGTGLGILNLHNIEPTVDHTNVPITLGAGISTVPGVAQATELGCDVVPLASAVTRVHDPVGTATAMRFSIEAGLTARESDRIPRCQLAQASLSFEGIITERISGTRGQDSL